MRFQEDLDQPILRLTPWDDFTLRSAAANVLVTGGTGSGKTSTAATLISKGYLSAGLGGLALCYKVDEADLWDARCRETSRSKSLIRWKDASYRFNFISYYLSKYGVSGVNSVIECLVSLLEMIRLAGASPGRASDQFWTDAIRQMLRHTLGVLYVANGNVTIDDIVRFIRSAPQTDGQMADPAWQATSYFYEIFARAKASIEPDLAVASLAYWGEDFAKLDPKTRSNILISLTTALGRLSSGFLRDLFTTDTNIAPELCFDGITIVMDMPFAVYGEDGIVAQLLFKHCFQQAMLARNGLPEQYRRRFVFLFMDECQGFIVPTDAEFLAVCRSSRTCVVCLTQSLPTIYAKIGGDNPQHRAQHFISNFATKVWFANSCVETKTWAANTIGRTLHRRANFSEGQGTSQGYGMGMGEGANWGTSSGGGGSYSSGPNGGNSSSSWNHGSSQGGNDNWNRNRNSGSSWNASQGFSEQMDFRVEPSAFAALKTGGRPNGGVATCIWYESGRQFVASGDNTLFLRWQQ